MRNLFLMLALALSSVSMAQNATETTPPNLALNGKATSPNGDANAMLAIDGKTDTRWEFVADNIKTETDANWTLDMGAEKEFDMVQILWEGAYSKSFKIEYATADAPEDWKEFVTVTGKELAGFPIIQNYKVDKAVKAKYLKFTNVARGTEHGVSFWEFRVFKSEPAVLTGIDLAADVTTAKVGSKVKLTVAGKDQYTDDIATGELTYEVTPAENGTVADGVFTPAKAGQTTIVAKAGDVGSEPVIVTSYDGEKIDIFNYCTSMVTPLGENTTTVDMINAFDDNMGSVWYLHAPMVTDDGKDVRTYETGFTIDLQALYDITDLSVMFEGACPADYTIAVSGDNIEFTNIRDVKDHAGMNPFTDFIITDKKDVRYIKFLSTKAATQYGIKIFDFSVYGEIVDEEAPVFTDGYPRAEFDLKTKNVIVTVKGSDKIKSNVTYTVKCGETEKTVTANNDEEATVVFDNLVAGEYTFSVTVSDGKNVSEAKNVKAIVKELTKIAIKVENVTVTEANGVNKNNIEKAFDGDKGTKWQMLSDGYGEGSFTINLGSLYNVDAVAVAFRDAASSTYTVELLDNNEQKVAEKTVTGVTASLDNVTETINALEGTEVRYVKYTSKGSTTLGWGVHIAEFTVYGTAVNPVTATVTEAGYATFSSDKAVKFGSDVEVFTVVDGTETVTLNKVEDNIVPANQGVVIKATAGTYNATVLDDNITKFTAGINQNNNLINAKEDTVGDESTIYVLNQKDGKIGFYLLEKGVAVGKGKAYLQSETAQPARFKAIGGGNDGTTGINNIKAENANGAVYNLSGCRVNDSYKGIVIINGKKVIRK